MPKIDKTINNQETDQVKEELMKKLKKYSNSLIGVSSLLVRSLKSKDVEFFNSDCQSDLLDVVDDYSEVMRELVDQKGEMEQSPETWATLRAVYG